MYPERYPEGGVVPLTRDSVHGILDEGGTIIGTTNRGNPTAYSVVQPDGSYVEVDRTDELVQLFRARDIDALVTVGGDGSMAIAYRLFQAGLESSRFPRRLTTTSTSPADVWLRHRSQLGTVTLVGRAASGGLVGSVG